MASYFYSSAHYAHVWTEVSGCCVPILQEHQRCKGCGATECLHLFHKFPSQKLILIWDNGTMPVWRDFVPLYNNTSSRVYLWQSSWNRRNLVNGIQVSSFFSTFITEKKMSMAVVFPLLSVPHTLAARGSCFLKKNPCWIFPANSFERFQDSRAFPSFPSTTNFLIRISWKGIVATLWGLDLQRTNGPDEGCQATFKDEYDNCLDAICQSSNSNLFFK